MPTLSVISPGSSVRVTGKVLPESRVERATIQLGTNPVNYLVSWLQVRRRHQARFRGDEVLEDLAGQLTTVLAPGTIVVTTMDLPRPRIVKTTVRPGPNPILYTVEWTEKGIRHTATFKGDQVEESPIQDRPDVEGIGRRVARLQDRFKGKQ